MIRLRLQNRGERGSRKKRLVFLSVLALFVIFGCFSLFFFKSNPETTRLSAPEPEPQYHVIEGTIEPSSSLFKSLLEKNIPSRWIHLIISELNPFVDFKRLKGGSFRFVTDLEGELVKFVFEKSPIEVYKIERTDKGYKVQQKEILLDRYMVRVAGDIRSSLYEAMNAVGEEDILTLSFAEILAWEIDFYQEVREGDQFQVLVEKLYKEDQFIRYGTIHAVEYRRGEKIIRGFRFGDSYYNENGISLKKPFLKSPLRFDRISSRFSHARRHPILGGIRPHYGIDYAAPTGTPVWAVADGTVVSVGWAGGFGKLVVVRHGNGYQTYYGHLSRYGPGIKSGVRIRQKQIIGYVGATGLATGPHLDYRLSKEGKFLDPLREIFPAGQPLQRNELEAFQQKRDELLVWLKPEQPNRMKLEDLTSTTFLK